MYVRIFGAGVEVAAVVTLLLAASVRAGDLHKLILPLVMVTLLELQSVKAADPGPVVYLAKVLDGPVPVTPLDPYLTQFQQVLRHQFTHNSMPITVPF
jgi:hypothetical protein